MERKWQRIITVLALVSLAGCTSHLTYGPNGQLVASNYSISETLDSTGRVTARTYTPFVPDRWYSDALDKLGPMISQLSPVIEKILAYFKVANVPAVTPPAPVTPAPVPVTPVPVTPVPVTPVPGPTPPPIASSVFSREGNTLTLDLNTLPGSMRAAGFPGSDNALYYAMAHIYAYGPGKDMVPHAELTWLNQNKQSIFNWFDGEVLKVAAFMRSNLTAEVMAISNDGRDRCGFRLGPAIMERLKEFGNRVTLGKILPPEEY